MCVVRSTALLLKRTHSLIELNMVGCSIAEDAACQLAEGLRANSTLIGLQLWDNQIGQKGAQVLIGSLAHSTSVCYLWLPYQYKDTIQSSVVYSRVSSRIDWYWLLVSLSFYMVLIYSYLCSLCMYLYTCMAWRLLLHCMILGNENQKHLHCHSNAHIRLTTVLVLTTSSRAACMQDEELVDYNPHTELFHMEELILW